jgi:hypothetical protein
MSMEDAIALAAALEGDRTDPDTLDEALAVYQKERSWRVARIQDAARPSLSWWEHFGRTYRHLPPWQFAFHFFSRSLPESKLRQRDPGFVDSVNAAWRQAHGGTEVLATPLTIAGASHSRRLVPVATTAFPSTTLRITAPDTEDGLDRAEATVARGLAAGACLVAVEGGTALTRRLLCEAARLDHGAVTMLIEDANEDSAVEDRARTAILSGRADLVGVPA